MGIVEAPPIEPPPHQRMRDLLDALDRLDDIRSREEDFSSGA
jgi:hypothetical protein